MEQKQGYLRKVKLKLEMPVIRCSGRSEVECFYRGKVISETDKEMIIEFKSHGSLVRVPFDKVSNRFTHTEWHDLKVL